MLSFLLASLCALISLPPSTSICLPCVKELCLDSTQNCTLVPAFNCPAVDNCTAGVVKDECGCCDICAKTIGEKCHEEPASLEWQGRCATGLKCVPSEEGSADMFEGFDYHSNYTVNRCEKGGYFRKSDGKSDTYIHTYLLILLVFTVQDPKRSTIQMLGVEI